MIDETDDSHAHHQPCWTSSPADSHDFFITLAISQFIIAFVVCFLFVWQKKSESVESRRNYRTIFSCFNFFSFSRSRLCLKFSADGKIINWKLVVILRFRFGRSSKRDHKYNFFSLISLPISLRSQRPITSCKYKLETSRSRAFIIDFSSMRKSLKVFPPSSYHSTFAFN